MLSQLNPAAGLGVVYLTVLCDHPYLVSVLFCCSAIPTSHYIFNN